MLERAGWSFHEYRADGSPELRQALSNQYSLETFTFPQIIVANGELVGGASELESALADGSIEQLALCQPSVSLPDNVLAALNASEQAQPNDKGSSAPFSFRGFSEERFTQLRQVALGLAPRIEQNHPKKLTATGPELVSMAQNVVPNGERADDALHEMTEALMLHNVSRDGQPGFADDAKSLYRLQDHVPKAGGPLNMRMMWPYAPRPAETVAAELQDKAQALTDRFTVGDGKLDYTSMRQSTEYDKFSASTAELHVADFDRASRSERLAALINVYNTLIIHALCERKAPSSFLDTMFFFNSIKYNVGGHTLTAAELEDGVLRNNSPNPAPFSKRPFGSDDPRKKLCITPIDTRIHFALNCGAQSCPPISTYRFSNLEEGLSGAASSYLSSEVVADESTGVVTVSKLFKYFMSDFGGSKESVLRSVSSLLPANSSTKSAIDRMVYSRSSSGIKLQFKPYDWTFNAST